MDDVDALLEILSVIKDVATNRFFSFAQRKANFQKFFDMFLDFFQVMQSVETDCPLLKNDRQEVTILTIASDMAFMSQLNSRVASIAFQQYQKNPGATVVCMGRRCAERLKMLGVKDIDRIFTGDEFPERYALALALRDYLVDRVMTGKAGKVLIVHLWAKTFSIIKPRILTLLPASELVRTAGGEMTDEGDAVSEAQGAEDKIKLIMESNPDKMMKALADTIGQVFSGNEEIKETLSMIEQEGYHVDLILASVTRVTRKEGYASSDIGISDFDRSFLEKIRIRLEEN